MEHLVTTLKKAWAEAPIPAGVTAEMWQERYSSALIELLAIHFGEAQA